MVFELVIKPIALIDSDEAVEYYEKKLQGLGERFYHNFLRCLEDIQSSPFAYSYIKNPVRRHLIEKFPYKVYYTITDEKIFIIGISHAKRSNAFIKRRLRLLE